MSQLDDEVTVVITNKPDSELYAVFEESNFDVNVGESAALQVSEGIQYIQSGKKEIGEAVAEVKAEITAHATQKTAEFDENAEQKTNNFNDNTTAKTQAFNTNATEKTNTFNQNASSLTADFNNNAATKTSDFERLAFDETADFERTVIESTDAFNDLFDRSRQTIREDVDQAATYAGNAYNFSNEAKKWAIGDPSEPAGNSAKYWAEASASAAATVGNGTITLTQGGETKGTFTTNQSGDTTINLDAGGSGGGIPPIAYATSTTAASTVEKVVSIPEITELNEGQIIVVKPTITSTVANSTIKLNDFDAYPMRYSGAAITTSTDATVWSVNYPSQFVFDGTYWVFLGHGVDTNTTYTINYSIDAGAYKSGIGNYAITRYSLCMQKPDMTWEKVTATTSTYSTGTSKSINTRGFILGNIRYYNTTAIVANGANTASNTMNEKAATLDFRYSTNCGSTPGYATGDYVYFVGTIGADGLFYLDTTQWWTNTLPTTNDGKLYVQIGKFLADYNVTLYENHPAYYYDGSKLCEYKVADNKQDVISDLSTIRSGATLGASSLQPGDNVSELTNDSGYITGISSSDVTTALGYTPADDDNVVKTSGDQTIAGDKSFSGYLQTTSNIVCKKNAVTKGTNPSSTQYLQFFFADKNGSGDSNALGKIQTTVDSTGLVTISMVAYKNTSGTSNAKISINYPSSGSAYTYAPTPASSDNSTKIATTAFVHSFFSAISGYDATKTQTLKNVNGTLTWVTD